MNRADQDQLRQRAAKARERLGRGLYTGPSVSDSAAAILYAAERTVSKRAKKASEIFLYDTWAFLGLANSRDRHHDLCVEADRRLEKEGYVAITSDYVFDETLTTLDAAGGATVARTLADLMLSRVSAEELVVYTNDITACSSSARRRQAEIRRFWRGV